MTTSHVGQVRALYKALLKLHRGLPYQLQAMGDQYVKDEFRRHKNVPQSEADIFMKEWTKYYLTIARQLAAKKKKQSVGENMPKELLDCFNDEQIVQLFELRNVATRQTDESPSDIKTDQS